MMALEEDFSIHGIMLFSSSSCIYLALVEAIALISSNCSRRDYHQVDEQDPFLPPSAASQAIAARTLRGQGSYPPTAPPLNQNAHGTNNTIKQPLLLTPPPPSYATATARARQLHESMLKFVHVLSFFNFFLGLFSHVSFIDSNDLIIIFLKKITQKNAFS